MLSCIKVLPWKNEQHWSHLMHTFCHKWESVFFVKETCAASKASWLLLNIFFLLENNHTIHFLMSSLCPKRLPMVCALQTTVESTDQIEFASSDTAMCVVCGGGCGCRSIWSVNNSIFHCVQTPLQHSDFTSSLSKRRILWSSDRKRSFISKADGHRVKMPTAMGNL